MHNMVDLNDVRSLIATLRTVYASQFNKQFPTEGETAIPMFAIERIAQGTLIGVSKVQFKRGLIRLNTSGKPFMPSFAEFRTLCVGFDWWSAQIAWSKACEYTKIIKPKPVQLGGGVEQYQDITVQAKKALDQVYGLIMDGEMYHAKKQFIELYESYVSESQLGGESQEWYQPHKALAHKSSDSEAKQPMSHADARKILADFASKLRVKPKIRGGAV